MSKDKTIEAKVKQPNLALLIFNDWLEHKMLLMLMFFVVFSSCSVIYIAWMNRQINTEIQQLQDKKDQLKIEWRHMLLEHNALAEHSRIELIARKKLKMLRPDINKNEKIKAMVNKILLQFPPD